MVRMLQCLGLALLLVLAGCTTKDPRKLLVGDLNTFAEREPDILSKLSEADRSLLMRFQAIYKPMATSGSTQIISGTAWTWGSVPEMTVTQTVSIAGQYFAFMAQRTTQIQESQAKAELERKAADLRKAAQERNRTPRTVTELPMELDLFCREALSETELHDVAPGTDIRDGADYRVNAFAWNVNFHPTIDGRDDSPDFDEGSGRAYYGYNGNWASNDAALSNGRLALKQMPRSEKWFEWQARFFKKMVSGPLTLAARAPNPKNPDVIEETYLFTLTGENSDGPKTLTLQCRTRRLSDELQAQLDARRKAAAEAEANRPRSPNERLIEQIEAKGGNCGTIGQHLRTHLQRAEQSGDWSRFQETLGRGAQMGC